MTKLRLQTEYIFARLGLWLIRVLPPGLACAAAEAVGSCAYYILPSRRKTAIDNVLKAGITKDKREARRIARKSFESIALAVTESLIVPKLMDTGKLPEGAVEIIMPEETKAVLSDPKSGAITVSGHFGNWELGAKISSDYKPITAIARKMNNPKVQELISSAKVRDGFDTIDKHESNPMKIVRVLRQHRVLAVLTDQHAHGDSVTKIDFFGHPAMTYPTPAMLQYLAKVPILFCTVPRTGTLRFKVEYSKPIYYTFNKETLDDDVRAATQDLANRLEAQIREYPEQYLWAHRRWRKVEN